MKIFLLEAIAVGVGVGPFNPWYDKMNAIAVIANNEEEARLLASKNCQDEGPDAWLNSEFTTCKEISLSESRVICASLMSA